MNVSIQASIIESALPMDRILDWWGEKTLADISRATCNQYCKDRGSNAAARRELDDLGSAINMAIKDGLCRHIIKFTVPKAPPKRTAFLEPAQVAQLLWRAYRRERLLRASRPTINRVGRSVIHSWWLDLAHSMHRH
jgi:hypothetical protein